MTRVVQALTLLVALGASLPYTKAENLLDQYDLNHPGTHRVPEGYKLSAKVPGEGVAREADSFILSPPDSEDGFGLTLPEDQDIWLSMLRPVTLEPGECYVFSVKAKWSELRPTGPGVPQHGPGFFIYLYSGSAETHRIAIIQPSGSSSDWVTVQIAFDTNEMPDFNSIRILLVSRSIHGTIQLKDASVVQIERDQLPESPQFILSNGEKVIGPKFSH